jgi:hypothetical protein
VTGMGCWGVVLWALAVPAMVEVAPRELCVTHGAVRAQRSGFAVTEPSMRAVVAGPPAHSVTLRFTYLGPTKKTVALRSGAVRRQLGVKLRAKDGCNVVYLMWRLEPEPGLVASVKRNDGERTAAECENGGYENVKPERTGPLPLVEVGVTHTLSAAMDGDLLTATVDGLLVWQGHMGPDALAFDGPAGVRTDNVALAMSLLTEPRPGGSACPR